MDLVDDFIDWSVISAEYADLVETVPLKDEEEIALSFEAVINGEFDGSQRMLDGAKAYAQRLDATLLSCPTGHAFLNGKHLDVDNVSVYALL